MLVFFRDRFQSCKPVPSIVRLQFANQCYVFDRESFEVRLNPSIEVVWAFTDRKLCATLRGRRPSIVEFIEGKYQLIEHAAEDTSDHANVRAKILEGIRHFVMPEIGDWRFFGDV